MNGGELHILGDSDLQGNVKVGSNISIKGNSDITGDNNVSGKQVVTGSGYFGSDLEIVGNIKNIHDKTLKIHGYTYGGVIQSISSCIGGYIYLDNVSTNYYIPYNLANGVTRTGTWTVIDSNWTAWNTKNLLTAKAELAGNSGVAFNCSTLTASSSIYSAGNITAYSDERIKEVLGLIENPLDILEALDGIIYRRLDTGKIELGMLAQSVEKVLPQIVETISSNLVSDGRLKTVDYSRLTPVLFEICKSLLHRIKVLEGGL